MKRSIQVHDEEFGTVTVPLRGFASVKPDESRETGTEVVGVTTEPIRVNESRGLFAAMHAARRRRAVLAVARLHETRRRKALRAALPVSTGTAVTFDRPTVPTRLEAMEALYRTYRQARRETAALMAYVPHDGRPPMVGTVSGTAANAQETRAAKRWAPSWVAKLHRDRDLDGVIPRRSFDGGVTWETFDPPRKSRQSSRKGRAVESIGRKSSRGRMGRAASLKPVLVD